MSLPSFRLSGEGETLVMTSKAGELVDRLVGAVPQAEIEKKIEAII